MASEIFWWTCEHEEADLFNEFNKAILFQNLVVRCLGIQLNVDLLSQVLYLLQRYKVFKPKIFQELIQIWWADEHTFLRNLVKVLRYLSFFMSRIHTEDEL